MSRLSYRLSMAVTGGRSPLGLTRERILANLLRKRAAAHIAGLDAQEAALREQIRWSLPIRNGEPEGDSYFHAPEFAEEALAPEK